MRVFFALLPVLIITLMTARDLRSEHVFLKDGSIVTGKIVSDAATTMTVRKKDGTMEKIQRNAIMRIIYADIYLGKVYIRLTSGQVLDVYLVDEDQNQYFLRKELYKAEEFTVPRNKVMFIARSNPTDLEGKADKTHVSLTWSPPFVPAETYKIYAKGPQNKDFQWVGETGKTSFKLAGLKSNSSFSIYVTAMDKKNEESLPSDTIEVKTLNMPPDPPKSVRFMKSVEKQGGALSWDKAVDPDGTVKEYRIYQKKGGTYQKLASTTSLSWQVPLSEEVQTLVVRAADDRGDESYGVGVNSRVWPTDDPAIILSVQPAFLFPFARFGEIYDISAGGLVDARAENFFLANLDLWVSTGCLYFLGREENQIGAYLVPITIGAGYRFALTRHFSLIPRLALGYTGVFIVYESAGSGGTGQYMRRSKYSFEPFFRFGLEARHDIDEHLAVTMALEYCFIYETDELMQFVLINAGAAYRVRW